MRPIRLPRVLLRHGTTSLARWAVAVFVLVMAACTGISAATGPAAPVPASSPGQGSARIWIYREYEPNESLGRPYVRFNGMIAGISEPGGSFYRDTAPGTYRVTVDSVGDDIGQFVDVAVGPGQSVFVKVEVSRFWQGDLNYTPDTFYTREIPPAIAAGALARSRFFGGG